MDYNRYGDPDEGLAATVRLLSGGLGAIACLPVVTGSTHQVDGAITPILGFSGD